MFGLVLVLFLILILFLIVRERVQPPGQWECGKRVLCVFQGSREIPGVGGFSGFRHFHCPALPGRNC